jgi:peptide deformylase
VKKFDDEECYWITGDFVNMAIRELLTYPEYKLELRRSSEPVPEVNSQVKRLVRDLRDTLLAHPEGIGLAAPQINIHQRVIIIRPKQGSVDKVQFGLPIALINPTVLEARDERRDYDGCLSFPNLFGETVRPHYLLVCGFDDQGNPFDRVYEGFDAVTVHHEIDHLDGVLFVDRIENIRDLYRIVRDVAGEPVRVPIEHGVR